MKIIYHNDLDGKCAGAIAYNFYNSFLFKRIELIKVDYSDKEKIAHSVKKNELVVVVDFSLDFDYLLKKTSNIVWIDHHRSAIDKYEHLGLYGERREGTAACVLAWDFFKPTKQLPVIVEMLGAYDVWDFSTWDEETLTAFQLGLSMYCTKPSSPLWGGWFEPDFFTEDIIEQGLFLLKERKKRYENFVRGNAFIVDFEGYKTVCCNYKAGSQLFASYDQWDYEIMMPFYFNGKEWIYSLYTKCNDIDLSAIASKHGGGGHKKAAGFSSKKLLFGGVSAC